MAILHLPPLSTAEVRPIWGRDSSPFAFGEAGLLVDGRMYEIDWERGQSPRADRGLLDQRMYEPDRPMDEELGPRAKQETAEFDPDGEGEVSHQTPKLPIVGTVRVRYTLGEPLKPRRFVFDDEE